MHWIIGLKPICDFNLTLRQLKQAAIHILNNNKFDIKNSES